MKISINSIRALNEHFGSTDQDVLGTTNELVVKIGSQLGEIEEITQVGAKFAGIIVAKVISCEKHPNADRLNVCLIDDGGAAQGVERNQDGLVQVVCGAPNVREGLTVAWLPPGSTVPDSFDHEPFVLGARELRGVVSNGMLASPKELAISDNHDGILEIDQEITPGTPFAEAFNLTNDVVINIENKMFTHRPDCFGFLGVARELAGIQGASYTSPEWYTPQPELPATPDDVLPLHIDNRLPELVPRFTAITMQNITVGPSPLWLQIELAKIGARSINNIVDLTNYYMLLTGQPLHAYDYDKVAARSTGEPTIVVRYPEQGETIALLNGKTVEPRAEAIMIATDQELIGVGGVMGGADTEVDHTTTRIILECANFNMYSIRRTSMANGLFTDAVTRFNKGQSPLQNLAVLAKIVSDIEQLGATVAGPVIDDNHLPVEIMDRQSLHPLVQITADYVNSRLGFNLSAEAMQQLLQNVEFAVINDNGLLTITAPFWRTDIEIREDVIEEIGRLYGFDKLPVTLPTRVISPAKKDGLITFKTKLRKSLVAKGANELLTYSFVPGKLLQNAGQDPAQAFKLSNALSPELQYFRTSLTPSLLEKIHPNSKAGYDRFALFEFGKGHTLQHADDDEGLPAEFDMLDLVVTASDKTKPAGAAYYQARAYLDALASDCGVTIDYQPMEATSEYPVAQPYDHTRAALVSVNSEPLGIIGEFTAKTRKAFKLPVASAGFSINPVHLMRAAQAAPNAYKPLPKFPKVSQDITLRVAASTRYSQLRTLVEQQLAANRPAKSDANFELTSIFQKTDDPDHKQLTLHVTIANHDRTLTDREVAGLLDTVASAAYDQLNAERV